MKEITYQRTAEIDLFLELTAGLSDVYLAGGACRKAIERSDLVTDLDIFYINKETYFDLEFKLSKKGYYLKSANENCRFFGNVDLPEVQLIKTELNCLEEILNSFDLLCCCIGLDCGKPDKLMIKDFSVVNSIKEKELVWNKINNPKSAFRRITYYLQKGYKLTDNFVSEYIDYIRTIDDEAAFNCSMYINQENGYNLEQQCQNTPSPDEINEPRRINGQYINAVSTFQTLYYNARGGI